MHVPSGLFVYGLYQREQNNGTQWKEINFNTGKFVDSAANETDVWYVKAGIKRAWSPVGATVLFGEWGQYNDMFTGLCNLPAVGTGHPMRHEPPIGTLKNGDAESGERAGDRFGSRVDGIGAEQEIELRRRPISPPAGRTSTSTWMRPTSLLMNNNNRGHSHQQEIREEPRHQV